jgi:hypothetical protein
VLHDDALGPELLRPRVGERTVRKMMAHRQNGTDTGERFRDKVMTGWLMPVPFPGGKQLCEPPRSQDRDIDVGEQLKRPHQRRKLGRRHGIDGDEDRGRGAANGEPRHGFRPTAEGGTNPP